MRTRARARAIGHDAGRSERVSAREMSRRGTGLGASGWPSGRPSRGRGTAGGRAHRPGDTAGRVGAPAAWELPDAGAGVASAAGACGIWYPVEPGAGPGPAGALGAIPRLDRAHDG